MVIVKQVLMIRRSIMSKMHDCFNFGKGYAPDFEDCSECIKHKPSTAKKCKKLVNELCDFLRPSDEDIEKFKLENKKIKASKVKEEQPEEE